MVTRIASWPGCSVASTVPAAIVGSLFSDFFETQIRQIELVAVTLVVGGVILWVADRVGGQSRTVDDVTFPIATGIGAAQAFALIPGISRSGISISAGRFAGLGRPEAARYRLPDGDPDHGRGDRVRGA